MLDTTKPVQTRDGRKARIICTDRKGEQPIIALVYRADNSEELCSFLPTGRDSESFECGRDLINIPEKRRMTVWVNVYDGRIDDAIHPSKDMADGCASFGRLACVPVEIEYEVR